MNSDLTPIFHKYESLRKEADALFDHVAEKFPACVKCHHGCSDCCNAVFDLPLVEAMYLNLAFRKTFDYGRERSRILEAAADVDRDLARAKKEMYRAEKKGEKAEKIMGAVAASRARCPLLTDADECALYEHRPITCRLYGIPQAIGDQSHVCGFSGFEKGARYPTVQMAKIQAKLDNLSAEMERVLESRFKLTDVYVPVSMALLTDYNDAYLGIGEPKKEE